MITGIVCDSEATLKMQKNELRIFDVIETVNDRKCSDILESGKTPQECFDREIKIAPTVKLYVNCFFAIPPISDVLSHGKYMYYVGLDKLC